MISLFYFFILFLLNLNFFQVSPWQNWAKNQMCIPIYTYYPKTKNELIEIIKKISIERNKICVIGSGHSFSNIACTTGYHINMKNFNKILSVDMNLMQVKVEGGILIKDFHEQIAKYDLAIANSPAIGEMTLAGAMCTATHGTGQSGTLSNLITQIELITADGSLHKLSKTDNPKAFKAACVSLGALGIIYSITLQCKPLFILEYSKKEIHINNLLEQYDKLFHDTEYFQFRWQLETDLVIADFWNRASNKQNNPSLIKNYSYNALQWDKNSEVGMVSEIAIPINLLSDAIFEIKKIVKKWNLRGLIIPELIGRFVKTDTTSYLSPSVDRDVIYLNIATDSEDKYYEFFKEFNDAMYSLNGRPHWGKINFLDYTKIYNLYGQKFIEFLKIKQLLDPNNIFSNSFTDKIIN